MIEGDSNSNERQKPIPVTPILPEWFDRYVEANILYPQASLGLDFLIAQSVIPTLREQQVTWQYYGASAFNEEQLSALRVTTAKNHRAHGIKMMPMGQKKETEMDFSDKSIQHIWNAVRRPITFAALDFTGGWNPEQNKWQRMLVLLGEEYIPNQMEFEYLDTYFQQEQNAEDITALSALFVAGATVLRTPEALEVAKMRRDARNIHKGGKPKPQVDNLIKPLQEMMKPVLLKTAETYNISQNRVNNFIETMLRGE